MSQNEHPMEILDFQQDRSTTRGSRDRYSLTPSRQVGLQKHENHRNSKKRDPRLLLIGAKRFRKERREGQRGLVGILFQIGSQDHR